VDAGHLGVQGEMTGDMVGDPVVRVIWGVGRVVKFLMLEFILTTYFV